MTQQIRFKIRLLLLVPLLTNGYLLLVGQLNGLLTLAVGGSVTILIVAIVALSEPKQTSKQEQPKELPVDRN